MDNQNREGRGGVLLFALLHLVCCGLPLLILSGVSLTFVAPGWPMIGVALAVLGLIGFLWYLKRGCATCPRDEGRSIVTGQSRVDEQPVDPGELKRRR